MHVASNPMLQAYLEIEKANTRKRRETERKRRQREHRREKRQDKKDRKNMQLLVGLAGIAVSVFTGKKHKKNAQAVMQTMVQPSSESESASDSDSESSINDRTAHPPRGARLLKLRCSH